MAFALFCVGTENIGVDADGNQTSTNEWTIPGVHVPVAMMIHSWLETSTSGWPIPKMGDEIPYHFETIPEPHQPSEVVQSATDEVESLVEESSPPPTEILLPSDAINTPPTQSPELSSEKAAAKVSYWKDVADLSRIDWWYTLRVLRDCSDLVSAGWCPPPSTLGMNIVSLLVSIAEKGLTHLANACAGEGISEQQIRKERLVACSCASESLAALKSLASRDVLPHVALHPLVTTLCRLLTAAEQTISTLPSDGSVEEQEEDALFQVEIVTQRTFVASNSAELLWVLLSNEGTSCPTIDALLNAIDIDLFPSDYEKCRDSEERVLAAGGAIRALSAALWGELLHAVFRCSISVYANRICVLLLSHRRSSFGAGRALAEVLLGVCH